MNRLGRLRDSRVIVALLALVFCAAPVPGDVGSCGQPATELDEETFFDSKDYIDCLRCDECGFRNEACTTACEGTSPVRSFPEGCLPLVHDGEVCLRALIHASCEDYVAYVDDRQPKVPTECNFCPLR